MRQFIEGLAAGSLVADVGCGNGKYFMVRQDIAVLGSDRSTGLAQVAATRLAAGTGAASGTSKTPVTLHHTPAVYTLLLLLADFASGEIINLYMKPPKTLPQILRQITSDTQTERQRHNLTLSPAAPKERPRYRI